MRGGSPAGKPYIPFPARIASLREVSAMEKRIGPEESSELCVTVHCADKGPSLESCLVSILSARLSKGGGGQL